MYRKVSFFGGNLLERYVSRYFKLSKEISIFHNLITLLIYFTLLRMLIEQIFLKQNKLY